LSANPVQDPSLEEVGLASPPNAISFLWQLHNTPSAEDPGDQSDCGYSLAEWGVCQGTYLGAVQRAESAGCSQHQSMLVGYERLMS
jgi:hypothetical protein